MNSMRRLAMVAAAVGTVGVGVPAFAQDAGLTERFSLDAFEPGTPNAAILGSRTAAVPTHLGSELGLTLNYAHRPLIAEIRQDGEETTIALVEGRWTANLGYTLGLFDLVALEAGLPFILGQSGPGLANDPREDISGALNSFAIGDMTLGARIQPLAAGPFRLVAGGRLWLPTGSDVGLVSDGLVRGAPFVAADVEFGPVLAALDLGYTIRGERLAHNFRSDDAFTFGLGVRWNAVASLDVEASLRGAVSPFDAPEVDDVLGNNNLPYPLEALGGVAWRFGDFRVNAAAGPGLNSSVGNPRWRALIGLGYSLDPQPTYDGAAGASGDAAGDGSAQGFDDSALRVDADGDGLDASEDMCPNEPGPADRNGCPVQDTDGDGLDDSVDACPQEPEDVDQFEDADGCPDPDNDGDGILDVDDACPLEAEVVNGKLDDDGCPDSVDEQIEVQSTRIEVRESVYFDTDRATIKQRSLALLSRIAVILNDHPEITKLSIEGHTDDRGSAKHNLDLSQRRAEAVLQYFISQGVDPKRLIATGFGESHPVGDNGTEEGRAQNRRVEFLIAERED